jgi:hypothetical protein
VDAAELAARRGQVARHGRPDREHHGVVALAQLRAGDRRPDRDAGAEDGALATHLVDAPVDLQLLHLELGDAVAQQPPGLSARS